MRKALRIVVAVVVVCAASPTVGAYGQRARSSPSRAAATPRKTPWERAVAKVPRSGEFSAKAALRLFEIAFGDLPGVKAPKNPEPVPSATLAIWSVQEHLDEYTRKQQRVIERLLAPPTDGVTIVTPPGGQPSTIQTPTSGPALGHALPTRPVNPELQADAERVVDRLTQLLSLRFQFNLPGPVRTHLNVHKSLENLGYEQGKKVNGKYDSCDINLTETVFQRRYVDQLSITIAHELIHCFQDAATNGQASKIPSWVREGSAEFTAAAVINNPVTDFWPDYVKKPEKHLFTRSYDGLGFFAHLAEVAPERVFVVMPLMWKAGRSQAAYDAAGITDPFLDSWASGYFRDKSLGTAWDMTGPVIPPDKPAPMKLRVRAADERTVKVSKYRNKVVELNVDADAIQIDGEGHVRLSDGKVDVILGSGEYCVRPEGCACPTGASNQAPTPLLKRSALALTGGTTGSTAVITGMRLKDLCCATAGEPVSTHGIRITPDVSCQRIGLHIDKAGGLKLNITYALLVDHPRLRPIVVKQHGKEKVTGVSLEGITGMLLDFGAGISGDSDNQKFNVDVPITVEVPVQPVVRGLPKTMDITWRVQIKTALTGNNSTLIALGQYTLQGPLEVEDGDVSHPVLGVVRSLIDSISGITLGPSGIDIAIRTEFNAGESSPKAMRSSFAALTASFGVTNGSSLGSPLVRCHGAALALTVAGGGKKPGVKEEVFEREQTLPSVRVCGTAD